MDLVLEIFDTLVFDNLYAKVLPARSSLAIFVQDNVARGAGYYNETIAPTLASSPVASKLVAVLSSPGKKSTAYGKPFLFDLGALANESLLPRESIIRQAISLFLITWIFGYLLYILVAGLSYYFVYDPRNFQHPKYLKNQVRLELRQSLTSIPVMTLLTVPWFVMELQGYSLLYWDSSKYGMAYMVLQFPLFLLFTDMLIYLIHRWLHTPFAYKRLHKPHHKWIVPTPFASHAFHPLDGYLQSVPYHVFPFVFPLQKVAYVVLFIIINVWTVMIHDGEYIANNPIVNGSACHTIHHLYFNYNYGQYTTLWDRLGGSHRHPDKELFDKSAKQAASTWSKQTARMEQIQKDVEGEDDRVYAGDDNKTK
jgi:lathosterol oxidase